MDAQRQVLSFRLEPPGPLQRVCLYTRATFDRVIHYYCYTAAARSTDQSRLLVARAEDDKDVNPPRRDELFSRKICRKKWKEK